MLIVSGPGTGKSTLFKKRLIKWLEVYPDRRVAVATFVRKLVRDLGELRLRVGYEWVHSLVDDHSRYAYSELSIARMPEEQHEPYIREVRAIGAA